MLGVYLQLSPISSAQLLTALAILNFQQDGWQEDPLFEFLAPRALVLPFLCCCATFALHCRSWLSLKSQLQVVMSCICLSVFCQRLYLRSWWSCVCPSCFTRLAPCPLPVPPPHYHHHRESWTGESPRSHPAPTPPRVHLPIVFWPWLTLHPPRIYFLAILFLSIPFSCSSSRFSVFSLPASPPGRLSRQP